ncbi:Permease of the drug/metabolite transporter (DMT) superfamily [Salinihabitans flavidus]|uniref:Permease of the drug/metabolite transporter (DMT) superfamily n=1 Tax=Salinihabitans flavidus TaxID=569882 RepID=A0A1H8PWI6_9RHOB|nr:DMT family transporter [Salinihabitans flavidus]SEO46034.1 Permease of the drug/metabolite transporter (DMT) superfamily [Salinihabitans flavidus]
MERKDQIDLFGTTALVIFAFTLAFNQVVIKVTNDGFNPVFAAALRSIIGVAAVAGWMWLRRLPFVFNRRTFGSGILVGLLFCAEFICLYNALDLTTVARASVIFYSMPVWLALAGHFLLPGEGLTRRRMVGLVLAMIGVAWAVSDRQAGEASLLGDVLALGAALGWAGIVLVVRVTPVSELRPEMQLLWQLIVSAVILLAVAPLFGALTREPEAIHYAGIAFQALGVVSAGYLFWFWLMTVYPASAVASFSFLSPVFSVLMGWALLGEQVGLTIWGALALVAVGLVLINRRSRRVPPG